MITGCEDQHVAMIVTHMSNTGYYLDDCYNSIQEHIADKRMAPDGEFGSQVEMLTLAHLLQTTIMTEGKG